MASISDDENELRASISDVKKDTVYAQRLMQMYNEDIGKPVELYGYRPINKGDIAAARDEWKSAERRSIAKYGHPGGLVAMPAGTWTPSMDWARSVVHLKQTAEMYAKEKPEGVAPEEWAAAVAELVEICDKLNAIVDEA